MRKLKPQKRDNAASVRGQEAVAEILTAARDVLVEEGYPKLTMRNVAKRAGITVGNLSYYYATKDDLLRDLLQAVIEGYMEDFSRISEDMTLTAAERLDALVRFLISDLSTKETTGFFPALWALAIHDDFAAAEMAGIYRIERNTFARAIAEMRPDLSKKSRDRLALFISASIEGQTMFIGHNREASREGLAIANIAAHSFVALVAAIDEAAILGLRPVSKGVRRRETA